MEYMPVLISQMKMIAVLMIIGFIWQKIKIFDDSLINALSAIIAKLILPLMLCTVVGSIPRNEITEGLPFFAATLITFTITVFAA